MKHGKLLIGSATATALLIVVGSPFDKIKIAFFVWGLAT